MLGTFFPLVFLVLLTHETRVGAQMQISITAPGAPNSFTSKHLQLASSLLESDTPTLWGVVSSKDVNAVCQQIAHTGYMNLSATVDAHVTPSSGPHTNTKTVNVQVTSMGGCLAATDGSAAGTKAVFAISNGRRAAVVCPNVAGSNGCGLYHTDEVTPPPNMGCFPGDATVILANGEVKDMAGLALGEKVAIRKQDGGVAYEDAYAFGHKDASARGHFIQLSLQPIARGGNISDPAVESELELESRTLELTPLHFAQVSSGPDGKTSYKRAKDIRVGDLMWAQSSKAEALTVPYQVTGVSAVVKQGLYNPFTLSGTIIVNGVAASTHSDWFLDTTFDLLGLTHRLPSAYQTILSPVRALYHILGSGTYISLYHHLDALLSLADFGTNYGGQLMLTTLSTSGMIAAVLISKLSKSS